MNANSFDTKLVSFSQLFGQQIGATTIDAIEIPLIQRDYAQGRQTRGVERIRIQFVDAICKALLPMAKPIQLDFIYGDVHRGKFIPLDGQQRLTLLFLLHCYLAWYQPAPTHPPTWGKFSYATRPSAREFCKLLNQCRPNFDQNTATDTPSKWLTDQADYLPTWKHDPTIQSMLVVLDELHEWFSKSVVDMSAAWAKLTDVHNPAIRFHLLPMMADDTTNTTNLQYIKMNSRGKPLTAFENFKALFEEKLEAINASKAKAFSRKIDTDWSDLLWEYRGDDNVVDNEFMRYFCFIGEICAWNSGVALKRDKKSNDLAYLSYLADNLYKATQPKSAENLDFLFHAFDLWQGKNINNEFENLLTASSPNHTHTLLIFNAFNHEGVDLFHACCRYYGTSDWDLSRTLLLYGILLRYDFPQQKDEITDFAKHLHILRNLIEASRGAEIREDSMPRLLADIRHIMAGNLNLVSTFNQEQKQNELDKLALLETDPALESLLYRLEDHDLLRGGLTAFELNAANFQARAKTFLTVFDQNTPRIDITGALLAHGNYAKVQPRLKGHKFVDLGAPSKAEPWRTLFRGKGKGADEHPMRQPLMGLLDALSLGSTLHDEIQQYIANAHTAKDWRYYLVKYPEMRQGDSGRYAFNEKGYEACMLRKDQMNSYHSDPYLRAAVKLSNISPEAIGTVHWPNSYYGYETNLRWLQLQKSGIQLRSVDAGWEVSTIPAAKYALWQQIIQGIQNITVTEDADTQVVLVAIEKMGEFDAIDRIELAANLLKTLVEQDF